MGNPLATRYTITRKPRDHPRNMTRALSSYLLITLLLGLSGCATRPPTARSATDSTTSGDRAYDRARRTGICHVHHTRMHAESATLIYTSYHETTRLSTDERTHFALFPFGEPIIYVRRVPTGLPRSGTILICPECVRAGQQWLLAHPAPAIAALH